MPSVMYAFIIIIVFLFPNLILKLHKFMEISSSNVDIMPSPANYVSLHKNALLAITLLFQTLCSVNVLYYSTLVQSKKFKIFTSLFSGRTK